MKYLDQEHRRVTKKWEQCSLDLNPLLRMSFMCLEDVGIWEKSNECGKGCSRKKKKYTIINNRKTTLSSIVDYPFKLLNTWQMVTLRKMGWNIFKEVSYNDKVVCYCSQVTFPCIAALNTCFTTLTSILSRWKLYTFTEKVHRNTSKWIRKQRFIRLKDLDGSFSI